eukprot:scaffold5770_cov388-Prasinococcus_capsulatus_cf.AAC.2
MQAPGSECECLLPAMGLGRAHPGCGEFAGLDGMDGTSVARLEADGAVDTVGEKEMVIEAGGAPRAAYKPSDFEMVKKLGQGSFSQVYEAALKATGEHFALKVMDKQFIQKENKVRGVVSVVPW